MSYAPAHLFAATTSVASRPALNDPTLLNHPEQWKQFANNARRTPEWPKKKSCNRQTRSYTDRRSREDENKAHEPPRPRSPVRVFLFLVTKPPLLQRLIPMPAYGCPRARIGQAWSPLPLGERQSVDRQRRYRCISHNSGADIPVCP
jgi:hypothetical protein